MCTDGNHKVTVVIEDPGGTDAALAWASATYAKLLKDASADRIDSRFPDKEDETPECEIHRQPMANVQGRLGNFWSCHQKNVDGSWCKFRPSGEA